ncbi:KRUF family protein [Toxoplasma gondii ME49]|uniref:KRUF family protein n=1 Tax=Toxoplasma gondii (strain ATCC 50611 / Me49) TaxID=508771 RepID=S8EU77_TOXGM|nr:KRUF family protein [Toxoplasma gondii ME49]EPT24523.1 KRUF family protein [Toxoplasma gondii ME49]|eukprot:XP_018634754.1 KRUF family protein [Toxoplasma gondii ME49]
MMAIWTSLLFSSRWQVVRVKKQRLRNRLPPRRQRTLCLCHPFPAPRRSRATVDPTDKEAARLESMASEIAAKLLAAGVDLSHVPGDASLTPGASDQGPRVGGDAAAPGTSSAGAPPGMAMQLYVRLGVAALRKEANELEELLSNKALYIEQHAAESLAQSLSPNPPDSLLLKWRGQAIRSYSRHESRRRERAATLRAQADMWEGRLASGDLLQQDPDEGSSSRETAPQPASKSDTTQGRRAGRRRGRQQGQDAGEGTAATGPSAPSVSSASPMSRLEGSLRGTLLGSSVALPDVGRVPYFKLAIENLRLEARRIEDRWRSLKQYVTNRIAICMLEENTRSPSPLVIRHWIRRARKQYSRVSGLRAVEAALLQRVASDLERKAAAEGLLVRSPQETPPHRPPSSTDLPGAGSEGGSSGFPPRPAPRAPDLTFADLAISNLRRDAEAIEGTWSHGLEYYVAQRAAVRMVRGNDPSPTPATQREWAYNDKKGFRADVMGHQQRARDLKDKANALEQELRALLSSASGQVPEPLRESGSTVDPSAEQSVERPSGKRKQKRKHLYHSSAESAGEGPSRGGAMLPALPLWLTPVSAVHIATRQRDPSNPPVAVGPSPGSSSPEQHLPAARRSQRGSGPSSSTREHPPPATGGPLPQRYTPVPTTTPPYPADVERGLGDPTPPHPKKRRLLEFLSDTARLEKTPPGHRQPLGRLALTSTASHMASSSQMASGPPQVPSLAGTHGRLSGSGGDIIPSLSLPLKKRPLRGPAAPRHAAAAAATPLVRQPPFRSGSLASAGTTSGTPSQPPSSMEPSAPASAPAGDPGVEPRGQLRPPDPH